jgi:hypothetical protein
LRLVLAFQAFFAILFSGRVPDKLLPAPKAPEGPSPEEAAQERERLTQELADTKQKLQAAEEAGQEAASEKVSGLEADLKQAREERATLQKELDQAEQALSQARAAADEAEDLEGRLEKAKAAREEAEGKLKEARDQGALALAAWLQREGRLVDFVMESIDGYDDAQVGMAVRAIHEGCRKVLVEGLDPQAILEGEEESPVEVPEGFDPVAISLSGNVRGEPPFKGVLMHHGWRAAHTKVPVPETVDPHVLAPAEVEL